MLTALTTSGLFTGGWATTQPRSFYDSFPGLGRRWVAVDGVYNEHLTRDVGAFYLALAAVGIWAVASRRPHSSRLIGLAWTVFSLPHLAYHTEQLSHLALLDRIGTELTLGLTLLASLYLLTPARGETATTTSDDESSARAPEIPFDST